MARINVLSKHIAELIAAGEVVERPASVVKELMENSIDAGATTITLEIRNGGVTYIRITDNGCGICREDVPKAFLSHATSKVKDVDDLNSIFTLGFRGEALASIAAVSRTELLTKTIEEEMGTAYTIEGGVQTAYDAAGCPNGTTIVVRDLFYNTPARMKFLKRDVSEANAVADVVDKIALSHPEISIRFIREGKQSLITPGDGKLLSAIYSVFGRTFAESLLEVDYELDGIKVSGYVCKPVCSRPSRAMQYFFLNNRNIKSRSIMASMENAYKNTIMVGKFPSCVLNVYVRPETVDVNVHPAKTEVRFSDERKVSTAVYYAVKGALTDFDSAPQVDSAKMAKLTEKAKPDYAQLQMVEEDSPTTFKQSEAKTLNSTVTKHTSSASVPSKAEKPFWKNMSSSEFRSSNSVSAPDHINKGFTDADEPDLVSSFKKRVQPKADTPAPVRTNKPEVRITEQPELKNISAADTNTVHKHEEKKVVITDSKPAPRPLRLLGEAFKTYIICEYDNKVCLIDKHAAHERIIYNKIKKNAKDNVSSQVLLTPITVTLNKNEYNTIIENLDVFSKAGYLVEDFGTGTVIVRECPMLISGDDIEDTIVEMALYLSENRTNIETEKIDRIHHTSACKAAIKAGYKNSTAEMKVLAEAVLYDDEVRYCPHGRPVLLELTKYELEKMFGRIQ
ncbi:MAG: DNA mismatch repair endonuclease MutL [Clostridia bacterium]|nr:DNA mismatch repair endonuclease MutL [Clostridia bacterium]